MKLKPILFIVAASTLSPALFAATNNEPAVANPGYQINFDKLELGKVPDEFMVLDGGFVVREEKGNRFLELPGAPLETFGVLFGPTLDGEAAVSVRIFGTAKGRRAPSFAVGLSGQGGYKLLVAAAKKVIELYKGEELVASAPYQWESGTWTTLKLELRKKSSEEWIVQGKGWSEKMTEPKEWMLKFTDKTAPVTGRASVWGAPYSGVPIRFDDFLVQAIGSH